MDHRYNLERDAGRFLDDYFDKSYRNLLGKYLVIVFSTGEKVVEFYRPIKNISFNLRDENNSFLFQAKIELLRLHEKLEPTYILFKLFHPRIYSDIPIRVFVEDLEFPFNFPQAKIQQAFLNAEVYFG